MAFDNPAFSDPFALLRKSVRIGRPFGVELRIYVTALFVLFVATAQIAKWDGVSLLTAIAVGLAETLILYTVVYVHEMGHVVAGWRHGIQTPLITLSAFGGLAHLSAGAPNPKAEIKIAFAGPLTHVLWIALAWPLSRIVSPIRLGASHDSIDAFGWIWQLNLAMLLFNLVPVFPMDGGRVLRGLLATRMHPNRATLIACRVGIFGAIGIGAWGLSVGSFHGGILIMIAISNVFACLREMVAARHSDGPYGPVDPWASSGEEWKQGVEPERHAEIATKVLGIPPGKRSKGHDSRTVEDDAELDALLDRVSAVGIAGLTDAERRRLTALSTSHRART